MDHQQELISVIMPAYNATKTLPLAVRSVLAQSWQNFELIIIDDCSTDETADLALGFAQADPRVRLLRNPRNSGASVTRHNGVIAAKGQWLAFLDSDDAWEPSKLQKQMALQKAHNADLVFTGSAFMDSKSNAKGWTLHVPETIGYRKLLKQNLISNSSVVVRKERYLECEYLGEGLHEDFVCWIRMLRDGALACGIDEPLLIYRLSATSKSGNKLKAAKMNWNAYRAAGLGIPTAAYYMVFYAINSLRKYKNLK